MKPFLYLDKWHAPQPETGVDEMLKKAGLEFERLRTNDGDFPAGADYCGVYVSPRRIGEITRLSERPERGVNR